MPEEQLCYLRYRGSGEKVCPHPNSCDWLPRHSQLSEMLAGAFSAKAIRRKLGESGRVTVNASALKRLTRKQSGRVRCTLELHEEVFMDKPSHPKVIRPWKTGPAKKDMQRVPPTTEPRRERSKEVPSFKRR
jgi:hypothetical protein